MASRTTTSMSSSYYRATRTPAAYALSSLGRLSMTPRTPLPSSVADKLPYRVVRERQDSTASVVSTSSSMSSSTISSGYSSCTEYDADGPPAKGWSSTEMF